jgi:riboflavin synthase
MFTGIVSAVGSVRETTVLNGGLEMAIAAPYPDLVPGESVAVDGACLTVERVLPEGFTVHLIATTLERTRFGEYRAGQPVNLERALQAGDRLGGHLVQGHVDGVGEIVRVEQRKDAQVSVPLGSITVDGVSLTVNAMPAPTIIQISLIPFTLQHTTLADRRPGDRVHLEADTIGKYVRALLEKREG